MAVTVGLDSENLEVASKAVTSILGVALEPRESAYHGGEYYYGELDGAQFSVERNFDVLENEPLYPEYEHLRVLLIIRSKADDRFAKMIDEMGGKIIDGKFSLG